MARPSGLQREGRSIDLEEGNRPGLTNRARAMGLALNGIAANLTDVVINVLVIAKVIECLLVKAGMYFLNIVGKLEAAQSSILAFADGLFDHLWVHTDELFGLTGDRFLEVVRCSIDATSSPQVSMGVNRLCCSCSAEEFSDLFLTFGIGLIGKGQVFAVCLRLSRKRLIQVTFSLTSL